MTSPKVRNRPGKERNRFRMMKPTFRAMVRAMVGAIAGTSIESHPWTVAAFWMRAGVLIWIEGALRNGLIKASQYC